MTDDHRNNFITAKQLAEALGVKLSWVYDQTRKGKLPHYKLGKYRRYVSEEVFQCLKVKRSGTDSSSLVQKVD